MKKKTPINGHQFSYVLKLYRIKYLFLSRYVDKVLKFISANHLTKTM